MAGGSKNSESVLEKASISAHEQNLGVNQWLAKLEEIMLLSQDRNKIESSRKLCLTVCFSKTMGLLVANMGLKKGWPLAWRAIVLMLVTFQIQRMVLKSF